MAVETLTAAIYARENGNPELACDLCRVAEDILGIDVTPVGMPIWYIAILIFCGIFSISGWATLFLSRLGKEDPPIVF